jgi:hypothetical protein
MIDESSSSPVIRLCPTRGVRRQTSGTKGDTVNIHVVNRRISMRWATMLGCRGRCRDRNEQDCNCKRDLCHEHTSSLSPGGRLNAPTAEDPSSAGLFPYRFRNASESKSSRLKRAKRQAAAQECIITQTDLRECVELIRTELVTPASCVGTDT